MDKEWTVLSCIVQFNHIDDNAEVVALGTGELYYFNHLLTTISKRCLQCF